MKDTAPFDPFAILIVVKCAHVRFEPFWRWSLAMATRNNEPTYPSLAIVASNDIRCHLKSSSFPTCLTLTLGNNFQFDYYTVYVLCFLGGVESNSLHSSRHENLPSGFCALVLVWLEWLLKLQQSFVFLGTYSPRHLHASCSNQLSSLELEIPLRSFSSWLECFESRGLIGAGILFFGAFTWWVFMLGFTGVWATRHP